MYLFYTLEKKKKKLVYIDRFILHHPVKNPPLANESSLISIHPEQDFMLTLTSLKAIVAIRKGGSTLNGFVVRLF